MRISRMVRAINRRTILSNRANASKSTGPRTRDGLERAAQNARRHGLTVEVGSGPEVLQMYRIIREDPAAILDIVNPGTVGSAALALARAEVAVDRALAALHERDAEITRLKADGQFSGTPEERAREILLDDLGLGRDAPEEARQVACDLLEISGNLRAADPLSEALRARRVVLRYLRDAENFRGRALSEWLLAVKGHDRG